MRNPRKLAASTLTLVLAAALLMGGCGKEAAQYSSQQNTKKPTEQEFSSAFKRSGS